MKKMLKPIGLLHSLHPVSAAIIACLAAPVFAQTTENVLPAIVVEGIRSVAEKNQVPTTTEGVSAAKLADTTNVMSTEDALKYLPNMLVRKRYIGDTQAPMATRTTGINAGARSLIFADGVLLSTLINNNNGNGSPQWFMVAPEEIERVDVMYGPFSAAYAGNSYGAVTEITTRMPGKFEAGIKLNAASQNFSQYGTSGTYRAQQVSALLGNRSGALAWWLGFNHLDSFGQPLTFLTTPQSAAIASAALPVVTGAYADRNRTDAAIQVVGASLTHTVQDNAKIKLAYDFTPAVSASYTLGYWQNKADTNAQSYLVAGGARYFGAAGGSVNIGGFSYGAGTIGGLMSNAANHTEQAHWMQSLALKTKMDGPWNWEAVLGNFQYGQDTVRTPTALYPAAQTGGAGRIADAGDTGWTTFDLKAVWRSQQSMPAHIVSVGAHYDQYKLVNPTYNTSDWIVGGNGALFSDARGKTRTGALWLQDVWRFAPSLAATVGGRYEWWRAYDGYNFSTAAGGATFPVTQPGVAAAGLSPKFSLLWQADEQWSVTGSLGKALRFPTVGELYQNVSTGAIFSQPNPFLKPESVLSGELALERNTARGKLRISLFQEDVSDSLISQTSTIAGIAAPVAFVQNVDKTRQRGIELVMQQNDVLLRGLELSGSITYVDARILANGSYVATAPGASSVGKRTPYVPDWRATLVATYRPDRQWAYTLAARYSSRVYATVDNTDVNPSTYQGFDSFFVVDARVRYQFDAQWSAALGVDNLNNRKYYLFHPFPQRTVFAELKFNY